MKKGLKIMLTVLVVLVSLGNIGCNSAQSKPEEIATKAEPEKTVEPEKETPKSNWSYSQKEDKMDDKLMYFAVSNSTNDLEFDFPYKGGSTLSIIVRNMNKENDVMLQISKGQFGSSYSQKVKIKFDDGKIESYSFSDAADGSSNYIFLENSKSLIAKLKAAKHLKIEAPFFQAGRQVAEFDVSGFEWPH